MRHRVAIPTLLACALALAGCQHTGALQAPVQPASNATVPADDNLNAVLWMQASAEYDAAAAQTYRAAIAGLVCGAYVLWLTFWAPPEARARVAVVHAWREPHPVERQPALVRGGVVPGARWGAGTVRCYPATSRPSGALLAGRMLHTARFHPTG